MGSSRAAAAVAVALFVAACSSGPLEPAPIVMMGAGPGVAGQAAGSPAAGSPGRTQMRSVIVREGQSVGGLARDHHVSKQAIIAANHLTPPYKIQIGKPLLIPAAAEPPVAIAAAAQPPQTLVAAAAPSPPPPVAAPAPAPSAAPAPPPVAAAPPPAPIAEARPQPEIIPLDGPVPTKAAPPPAAASPTRPPEPPPQAASAPPPPPAATLPLTPLAASAPAPEPPPAPLSRAAAEARAEPAAAAVPAAAPLPAGGHFPWPVKGRVLAGYGATSSGGHNDGINIAASRGTPVAAVDGGIVAYAGNELRGYGNLVLIKHASGWISAYAHCDELLVKRGDPVSRGQAIAKVGTTGGVSEPQLHFELRRGKQPVDPRGFLAAAPSA